jgi:hypothetical protein
MLAASAADVATVRGLAGAYPRQMSAANAAELSARIAEAERLRGWES